MTKIMLRMTEKRVREVETINGVRYVNGVYNASGTVV
jgi:hypothetical protein